MRTHRVRKGEGRGEQQREEQHDEPTCRGVQARSKFGTRCSHRRPLQSSVIQQLRFLLYGTPDGGAMPSVAPPAEQPPEQSTDLLQLHQQRHEKKRMMNASQTRQKQKALTRRQRRNDARGYVPPPGAEPRTVERADHPTPEEQLIRLESINATRLDHNKKFVTEREAAIIGIEDHKMREEEEKRIQKYFKEEG